MLPPLLLASLPPPYRPPDPHHPYHHSYTCTHALPCRYHCCGPLHNLLHISAHAATPLFFPPVSSLFAASAHPPTPPPVTIMTIPPLPPRPHHATTHHVIPHSSMLTGMSEHACTHSSWMTLLCAPVSQPTVILFSHRPHPTTFITSSVDIARPHRPSPSGCGGAVPDLSPPQHVFDDHTDITTSPHTGPYAHPLAYQHYPLISDLSHGYYFCPTHPIFVPFLSRLPRHIFGPFQAHTHVAGPPEHRFSTRNTMSHSLVGYFHDSPLF